MKRSQFDKLNKMHLLRNRHICTGRPHFEFITNVQLVERVGKWENVYSCKKYFKRWICRDYTMKIRTKINSEFAKFAPDYKRGHTAHLLLDWAAADYSGQSTILLVHNTDRCNIVHVPCNNVQYNTMKCNTALNVALYNAILYNFAMWHFSVLHTWSKCKVARCAI